MAQGLEPLSGGPPSPPGAWLGRASLALALVACLGEGVLLLADLGWVPRAAKFGGGTLVVVGVCWLTAVVGGAIAALWYRSRSGCLAAVLCLLMPVGFVALAVMVGSGWLD